MQKKPRILIVDDERAIADTLAAILRSIFEVHVAYCGQQALEIAAAVEPDLVLSDVIMPDKNGVEVAMRVSEMLPRCKILLFSGSVNATDLLEKARELGKDWAILSKPVHPRDLLVKIDELEA